jgi:hypothetical protein
VVCLLPELTSLILKVFFGLRNNAELVIRAKNETGTFELIPHKKLDHDLPRLLVDDYAHWLNLDDGTMELRPIQNLWTHSTQNWLLKIPIHGNGQSTMQRASLHYLIDARSSTMKMISKLLAPLESQEYLTVTISQDLLQVDLPRLRLSFFLNQNLQLESQNMPGMFVDSNQSSGTMFGLSSQLVLCSKNTMQRQVLIPQGIVEYNTLDNHVHIVVNTQRCSNVIYHTYGIDQELGRLTSNVSMLSRLYKIYLHAISSHCLPDPLTGHTGTEEALNDLQSAGSLSFQELRPEEIEILNQIGSLTPKRSFYPAHLKVMQEVTWSKISPSAQHHDFFGLTQLILGYAQRLQILQDPGSQNSSHQHQSQGDISASVYLTKRAAHRHAWFYPTEFCGKADDAVHVSRDHNTADECAVATVSALVHAWPARLQTQTNLLSTFKKWGIVSGPHTMNTLDYNCQWLQPDLANMWMSVYELCRKSSKDQNSFQLAFSLSALAYCLPADEQCSVHTLLSFATITDFRLLQPPPWPDYNLTQGFKPDRNTLEKLVLQSKMLFCDSPEAQLVAQHGESQNALARRSHNVFKVCCDSQAKKLVTLLMNQWPCKKPTRPHCPSEWYVIL